MPGDLSVLQNANADSVRLDPFPHIVLDRALPDELYARLVATRPAATSLGIDETANNVRWDYGAGQVAEDDRIDPLWKEFIAYHSSGAFFGEISRLFFEGIQRAYPARYPTQESLTQLRVGVRKVDDFETCDVLMDAQISGNTPVLEPCSVRGTHIDEGGKLFSGLFYMRAEADDSIGGDLEISRFAPAYATVKAKSACFDIVDVPDQATEIVETVKYAPNRLVLFINSLDALHGVTVRQATPYSRQFVNLIGEVDPKLYVIVDGHPVYVAPPKQGGLFRSGRLAEMFARFTGAPGG